MSVHVPVGCQLFALKGANQWKKGTGKEGKDVCINQYVMAPPTGDRDRSASSSSSGLSSGRHVAKKRQAGGIRTG